MPKPIESIMMTEVVPIKTPKIVRKLLSFLRQRFLRLIPMRSLKRKGYSLTRGRLLLRTRLVGGGDTGADVPFALA